MLKVVSSLSVLLKYNARVRPSSCTIFDADFSGFSYGFRPERSQHDAVKQLQSYIETGKRIAVDVDLSKFFG